MSASLICTPTLSPNCRLTWYLISESSTEINSVMLIVNLRRVPNGVRQTVSLGHFICLLLGVHCLTSLVQSLNFIEHVSSHHVSPEYARQNSLITFFRVQNIILWHVWGTVNDSPRLSIQDAAIARWNKHQMKVSVNTLQESIYSHPLFNETRWHRSFGNVNETVPTAVNVNPV